MTSWFRSWHGAATDPKWLLIAQRTQTNAANVAAVFWALMDCASQAEQRGDIITFDCETYAAWAGMKAETVGDILEVMREKNIINNMRLVNWERRQPKREDGSAERAKAWRERNQTQPNAVERHRDRTDTDKKVSRTTGKKPARPTDEEFEIFKRGYPRRKGGNPWPRARKSLSSALEGGADFAAIMAALKANVGFDPDKIGTEFIPQAATWLNARYWEDYKPPQLVELSGYYAAFSSPELEAWNAYEKKVGKSTPRDKAGGWRYPSRWPPGYSPPEIPLRDAGEPQGAILSRA